MFSLSIRAVSVIMIGMVIITGVVVYWMISPQPTQSSPSTSTSLNDSPFHQVLGVQVVHGAEVPDLNCGKCHTEPIPFTDCADCHGSIPTRITNQNIEFPHHDVGDSPGDVDCQECHASAATDARFVQIPTASMSFCDDCHEASHD
jgi:hypothetical protein